MLPQGVLNPSAIRHTVADNRIKLAASRPKLKR